MAIGLEHQIPGTRQFDRLQPLAHPFCKGGASAHKHRHIGPQLNAKFCQFIFAQACLPEVIERHERGGCIRGSTADTTAHGQQLLQPDMGPLRAGQPRLQQAGGADDEVLLIGHAGNGRAQGELVRVRQWLEFEPVAVIQKDEQGLQLVIAVRTTAIDIQEKVEFGRCRPANGGHSWLLVSRSHQRASVHWLICNLRRLPWPVMVSRWGRR
ncbi:hypothetical protein NX85_13835 [Aeromonas salmonicida subsp. salmonicida]|nr:hypothetical protein NV17_22120 [Aeromonas salmonicida subsp. salmonicida]KTA92838.1 hypothetical protein VO71_11605 [Aeromonas salmonicida subsp. smithia]KHF00087.1 hypothetical protein NX85_13835 [Aeromonas salmonicida subsp. salmonicida]KIX23332.1 hypothetical protein TM02_20525 [Aeromonas salmonicida subsp. salmonicida]KTA87292.1 hypothetical protein UC37_21110 [Aeromonas salmonicida subsp. salmonicida]